MYAANHKNPKPAAVAKHEVQKEALPIEVPPLSLDEVKEKTENFGSKALIGEGSYGRVYYATLNDGVAVALKKLDVAPEAESDAEFLSQVINLLQPFLFLLFHLLCSEMNQYPCIFSRNLVLHPFQLDILILCSSIGFHGF